MIDLWDLLVIPAGTFENLVKQKLHECRVTYPARQTVLSCPALYQPHIVPIISVVLAQTESILISNMI